MEAGFQLNPAEIAENIHADVVEGGWSLRTYADAFAHPDFNTGMTWVLDPVDRTVVVFVGSKAEASAVVDAAYKVLGASEPKAKRATKSKSRPAAG